MAKQLTAPGCIYSIVARVDTTIYSPDQTWILDVPAGQTDFIAETNEVIIPADAMMRRKTRQHIKDRDRINLLGKGSGSLDGFITRAIEQIVGKGNVTVTYEDGKMTVVLAESATDAQLGMVESLLDRLLPKDVEGKTTQVGKLPTDYMRLDFLESTGTQGITFSIPFSLEDKTTVEYMLTGSSPASGTLYHRVFGGTTNNGNVSNGASGSDVVNFAWNSTCYLTSSNTTQSIWAAKTSLLTYKIQLRTKNTAVLTNGKITLNGYSRTGEKAESDVSFTSGYQLFGWGGGHSFGSHMRTYSFKHERNGGALVYLVPALDPAGVPCMYDTVTGQPFRNDGTGQFIVGMTLEQVRGLSLPAGGGQLTLSLPHEASIDKMAQTALEQARENGWELTLRYAESDVPAGYRKLDFLESTSTQWIDAGVPYASDTCIETTFEITQFNDGYSPGLFGTENSNNANEARFGVLPYSFSFRWDYGSQLKHEYVSRSLNTKYKLKKDGPDNYIDDVLVSSNTPGDFISDSTGLIFSRKSWSGFIGKIYSFTISRAGELQADFIPCIAPDGKLGMYNKVDGTLKENAGSGAFIAGLATVDDVLNLWLPETGGELTVSVPADTPDSAVDQLRNNNPTWQIAIQFRTDNEN